VQHPLWHPANLSDILVRKPDAVVVPVRPQQRLQNFHLFSITLVARHVPVVPQLLESLIRPRAYLVLYLALNPVDHEA